MAAGPMEKAIRATLKELEVSPVTDARARLAVVLAVSLDAGAGMATAAISRELRATLSELENRDGGDTDGFADLLEQLSAPVVNTKN
jgi:hypothetical protein